MPRTSFITLASALALVLAACAPAANAPTPNATESNATSMAAANAILTETRAVYTPALRPTAVDVGTPPATAGSGDGTPFPVTGAPTSAVGATAGSGAVTNGFPPFVGQTQPTLVNQGTSTGPGLPVTGGNGAVTPAATSTNPCNTQGLDLTQAGPKVRLVIRNDTRGPISFALGMSSTNSFGQCGVLFWQTIDKDSKVVVNVPQTQQQAGDACYWAYAIVRDPRNPATVNSDPGGMCLSGGLGWIIDVNYNKLALSSK